MRNYSFAAICLSALTACTSTTKEKSQAKPNILIIYADDLGIGDLSCYGSKLVNTPNIDAIAQNGIRFTNAYCTAAMCTPSRYSMLSGNYAFRLEGSGILSAEDPMLIKPGSFTLPEMLRQNGYRTGIVGKWHLGLGKTYGSVDWNGDIKPGPLEVGFDESFLLPVTNDRVPTVFVDGHRVLNLNPEVDPLYVKYPEEAQHSFQEKEFGKNKVADNHALVGNLPTGLSNPELLRYPADPQHSGTIVNGVSRIGHMSGGKSAWWDDETLIDVFAEKASAFITKDKTKPFFLYLAPNQCHVPRIPGKRFLGKSGVGLRGDCVLEFDWIVGEMISLLDKNGQLENTLVIISSDNGPVLYDGYSDGALEKTSDHDPSAEYRGGKYIAYDAATRMPTLLQWPGRVKKGIVSDALLSQVDFLASFAALVGSKMPGDLPTDSRNFLTTLLGESTEGREFIIQQSSDGLGLRSGKWKYIAASNRSAWAYNRHNMGDNNSMHLEMPDSSAYLFDIEADQAEMKNIVLDNPEKAAELKALLNNEVKRFTVVPWAKAGQVK